jgi:hypothetical protein
VGVRIERKDLWRQQKSFSIVNTLPNVIQFENKDILQVVDRNQLKKEKSYQYKVSSISKSGKVESVIFTPAFSFVDGYQYTTEEEDLKSENLSKFVDFDVVVYDNKRIPIICKVYMNIIGDYERAELFINEVSKLNLTKKLSHFYYLDLEPNKSYNFRAEVFFGTHSESKEIDIRT